MLGRTAFGGYRLAMRLLVAGAVALAVGAVLVGTLLWQLHPAAALLALPLVVAAGLLGWWRLAWGAPLDWIGEHADPDREVPLRELPARLRELARETRTIADVPARLSDELDALAGDLAPIANDPEPVAGG